MSKVRIIKARALRYFDALVAIILLCAAGYLLALRFGIEVIGGGPTIYMPMALTILLAALLSTRLFQLVLRVKTLRYIADYPSVSVVSVAILSCAVYCIPLMRHYRRTVLSAAGVFIAAIVARALWTFIRGMLTSRNMVAKGKPIGAGWPNELQWILDEKPIETVKDDQFDYSSLVYRLASMVEQNTCQSFGLTGLHGSGKTSVLKMVKGELRKRSNKYWFEFVGGWGRTGENVSASVLDAIVRRLHEEGVEALSLLTWPADYMREILGDSSFMARTLRCCIQSQQDSVAVLQRLDPVLDAINKRVIVVVEDVDRNATDGGMNTLCHLLDDFRQTRNVSFFFLKSEETETSIDFHRLCEHTEMMPRVAPDVIAKHLEQIMQAAKSFGSTKLLLHADRLDIKRLFVLHQVGGHTHEGNIAWSALSALAHTPRSLKHALRRTMRIWTELAGEVDLLELLLWALLREGCPKGYDYLRNSLQVFRHLPSDIVVDEKKAEPIRQVRKQIAALGLTSVQEQALKVVLTIFGFNVSIDEDERFYIGMTSDLALMGRNLPTASQSISKEKPSDYFNRLEAGALDEREMSDQRVFREMQQYAKDRTGTLPVKVAKFKPWAEKIVQFEGLLPTERLLDMIEDHIGALGNIYGGKASDDSPGFMDLRDLWRGRGDAFEPFSGRLESILLIALDHSLELAHSIYERYGRNYNSDIKLRIRERWIEGLRGRVERRADYLGDAMDAEHPWALFHTMRFSGEYPAYNTPRDWQWLVPHLIAAITKQPGETVPDVAHLLIRDMRGPRGGEGAWFELDAEYFEGMCPAPEDRAALATGLLQYVDSRPENDSIVFMIQYVKENLSRYCMTEKVKTKTGADTA